MVNNFWHKEKEIRELMPSAQQERGRISDVMHKFVFPCEHSSLYATLMPFVLNVSS